MPMAFQLLLVISGVESPTQATEDSSFCVKRAFKQEPDLDKTERPDQSQEFTMNRSLNSTRIFGFSFSFSFYFTGDDSKVSLLC